MRTQKILMTTASLAVTAWLASPVTAQDGAARKSAASPAAAPASDAGVVPYRSPPRHLIYIATPGDEGADDQSGVIVLDADHDYRFVKRIPYGLAASEFPGPKISGMTSSIPANKIYVTTDGGSMIAFDLKTDKIAWTFKGETGPIKLQRRGAAADGCCERPYTLPGGKTLLVASAYNNWWYLIDAQTGKKLGRIDTPETPHTHNVAVTADGKLAVLASISGPKESAAGVAVVDLPNKKVLRYITFSDDVRPITINHDGSLVYANVNNLDGFEIADTRTGKMIKRVELPGEMWKAKWADPNHQHFGHGLPSHGIGMTPDESEIWVTDAANSAWQIWDNPGDGRNPVYNPAKTVPIQPGIDSSWISMTNDGKTAFVGDGSIIDVRAHRVIATMKDEYGRPIHAAEKVLAMTFRDGKLVETSNQFAIGDAKAVEARIEREHNRQASNNGGG
jgi:DNA-binding beta-propeller fold protein YncE